MKRDPTEAELRQAIMPHARLLGCTCRPAIHWRRHGEHASIEVEHRPWCAVGRDGPEAVGVRAGR
jgi:hypothetical protein